MIECTPEQFAKCVEIYQDSDSALECAYRLLHVLGLSGDQVIGEEWHDFMEKICAAVKSSDASIKAPEPHQCCCTGTIHDDSTCACAYSCHEKTSTLPPNVQRMYELATSMADTYARKNADYGDSFHTSVQKYGLIAALTRMSDKWNRLENLMLHGNGQVNESITDTLIDLAAYALMTVMEIE